MIELAAPVIVFTVVVVVLTALVLVARSSLVPATPAAITVNGERKLTSPRGMQLLWALAANGIYLPAACGGRGICGQCRVKVTAGGGALLPTEAALISRADAARGQRLGCMLRVRDDLAVEVPQSLLDVRRWSCAVRSSRSVAPLLKEVVLTLPPGERLKFRAGDYILLEAPAHRCSFRDFAIDVPYRTEWERLGLFELESSTSGAVVRAYSLANSPGQDDRLMLVVRIALPPPHARSAPPGQASSYIFSLAAGDGVAISGPFGEFHAADGDAEMILIAGGAGIAPIRSIILDQLERSTQRTMSFWYGARTAADLCYRDEFDRLAAAHANFRWHAALSEPPAGDAWKGDRGFIHSVVYERYLRSHKSPEAAHYYLCGPPLMSAAVVHMVDELGVPRSHIHFDDFGA